MQKLKNKMKVNKIKKLCKKYKYFTITENGIITAVFYEGLNKMIYV